MKQNAQTNQTKPTNKSNETQTNPHKKKEIHIKPFMHSNLVEREKYRD